jgi:dTDP-4-dehydrorhamnose 3,5-epimerase
MSRFSIHGTPLAGLKLIERKPIGDERGFLQRLFCQESFESLLGGKTIRQVNHTVTRKAGTIRGMHFQYPPNSEIKIVSCLKGKVWDVAVDLRKGSPTFLKYHAVTLSEDMPYSCFIPEGFAHGFQALTLDCKLIYFHTADYDVASEGMLNALDPALGIQWPVVITERSMRDEQHAMLPDSFAGVEVL